MCPLKKSVFEPLKWIEGCSGEKDSALIKTPIGNYAIYAQGNILVKAEWVLQKEIERKPETDFLIMVIEKLNCYWQDPDLLFQFPLLKQGTEFQRRVWSALINITYQQTFSYAQLAKTLNTGARAVGGACRKNPYPLIIPCHRIVGISGPGGYAGMMDGELANIKKKLLMHEASFAQ